VPAVSTLSKVTPPQKVAKRGIDMPLGTSDRDAEPVGHVTMWHALDPVEHERVARDDREFQDRLPEQLDFLSERKSLFRCRGRIGELLDPWVADIVAGAIHVCLPPEQFPPVMVGGQIRHCLEQKRPRIADGIRIDVS